MFIIFKLDFISISLQHPWISEAKEYSYCEEQGRANGKDARTWLRSPATAHHASHHVAVAPLHRTSTDHYHGKEVLQFCCTLVHQKGHSPLFHLFSPVERHYLRPVSPWSTMSASPVVAVSRQPDNPSTPSQLKFVRSAQMSLFARVTCYPPLGEVTCVKRLQKALNSSEDDKVS
jgi:hypothetical protein